MSTERSIDELLQETFGFSSFRPGQEPVVRALLDGRSSLAVFPTGGGKSLCYQLPALMLEGMTLVVSPLIALMKDQIDFLVAKGVRAARLDSSLTADESRAVWDDLWEGRLKLLYVAPERFASERFLQRLRRSTISLMVIDEAHCISEWGHNFRPDYMKLAELSRELGVERALCLTATATPSVADDIRRGFDIADADYVNTGFHRPNLTMRVTPCDAKERERLLLTRMGERPRGATIVYVTLQKTAEQVAALLSERGFAAQAYHAGMDPEDRHAVQDAFMGAPDSIVVATIAFGMGIDKSDIRYVYHYNMPKSLENYMQETGRAGRDGVPSSCDLFVCPDDVATLENFTYGDTPTEGSVRGVVESLLAQDDRFDISVYELSNRFDMRTLVLSTLLTYLELEGILVSTGPIYNEYKFQPHRPSSEILPGLDAERAELLRRLLPLATKARTWFTIDMAAAAAALNAPRESLVAAINDLEQRGDVTLKVAGVRRGYRYAQRPEGADALVARIVERFQTAELRDIERIAQVVQLAGSSVCSVRQVLDYFGEVLAADCGHCDRCLDEPIPPMPEARDDGLTESESALVQELAKEGHAALQAPRQIARFLCGLSSPAASRARLMRDPRFGRLSHRRFLSVAEAAGGFTRDGFTTEAQRH